MRVSPVLLSNPNLTRRKYVKNSQNPLNNNQIPKNVLNSSQNVNFGISEIGLFLLCMAAGVAIDVGTMVITSESTNFLDNIYDLFHSNTYSAPTHEESRKEEAEKLKKEVAEDVEEISKKTGVSQEKAQEYLSSFAGSGSIKATNDGNEKGLNAIIGYDSEKYDLMVDFITPIIRAHQSRIPEYHMAVQNGLLLYGPPGSGKTYMADKICEHLQQFGVQVKEIYLDENDHDGNAEKINKAFQEAIEEYKETERFTVLNFKKDMDNYFIDRNKSDEYRKEVSTLMHCADNVERNGVVWIATANNPKDIDKALLRPGRLDMKLGIGKMKDFAISDMIKYSLIKYGQRESADNFDYEKVVNYVREQGLEFTPSEYERDFVKQAVNRKGKDELVDADSVIKQIKKYVDTGFMTLDDDTKERFKKDEEYIDENDDQFLQFI